MADVLVTDDDAESRVVLRFLLECDGHFVYEAADCATTLARLRRHPRPRHVQADAEQQAAFKKTSARSSRQSRPPSLRRASSFGQRTNIALG